MLRKFFLALITTLTLVSQVFGMNQQVKPVSRCDRAKQGAKRLFCRYAPGLVSAMSLGYAIDTCVQLDGKAVQTQEDWIKAGVSLAVSVAGFAGTVVTTLKPKLTSVCTAVADTGLAALSAASSVMYLVEDINNHTLATELWGTTKGSVGSLVTNAAQLTLSVYGLHQVCKENAAKQVVVTFPLDSVSTEDYQMLPADCYYPVSGEGAIQ